MLRGGELSDRVRRLIEQDAAADEEGDQLFHLIIVSPLRQIIDIRTVPNLRRRHCGNPALDAGPVGAVGARGQRLRCAERDGARRNKACDDARPCDGILLGSEYWIRMALRRHPRGSARP